MNVVERTGLAIWPEADIQRATADWLGNFEQALVAGDAAALQKLFGDECHWRDLVAFTWHNTAHVGREKVTAALVAQQRTAKAHNFHVAADRTPPRVARRLGL